MNIKNHLNHGNSTLALRRRSPLELDRIPYSIRSLPGDWFRLTYFSNWLRKVIVTQFSSIELLNLWVAHLKRYGVIDK